ncbi:MAG: calcium-binding protein [Hellea sp.]
MYFLDRFSNTVLTEFNFDTLSLDTDQKAMLLSVAAPNTAPVNAPTPPGPLFATINGDAGDNTLNGTAADDTINGFAGNDTINGGGGTDELNGGDGDDTFIIDIAGVQYLGEWDGGAGHDRLLIEGAGYFDLNATGMDFDNIEEIEFSFFAGGDRTIELYAEEISSSELSDTLHIDGANGGGINNIIIRMDGDLDDTLDISGWTFQDWNNLEEETITIIGDGDDETITGSSQDDIIEGGAGADTLDGGAGIDTLSYAGSSSGVSVALNSGAASNGDAAGDTIIRFENVIGSDFNDNIVANSSVNHLESGGGDDILTMFAANDGAGNSFDGGTGVDTLEIARGGVGLADLRDDTLLNLEILQFDNNGGDPIVDEIQINAVQFSQFQTLEAESHAGSSVTLSIFMDTETILDLSGLTVTGFIEAGDNITITGDADSDIITGSSANDIINGGAGNDTLSDGAGIDILMGGSGDDIFLVNAANNDWASFDDVFDGGEGIDTLQMTGWGFVDVDSVFDLAAGTYTQGSQVAILTNFENFDSSTTDAGSFETVLGTDGDNIIQTGEGANTIDGRGGNDTIVGGLGDDTLIGGSGNDTLDFSGATSGMMFTDFDDNGATAAQDTGQGLDTIRGFETVIGSAFDDVIEMRGESNDSNNVRSVLAGAGNDTVTETFLLPGDSADGGDGVDTFIYDELGEGMIFDMMTGVLTDEFGNLFSSFINFENVMGTNDVNRTDDIKGTDGVNEISGRAGNDTIDGRGGDDILDGGDGDDTFIGGAGADSHDGGAGSDTITYINSASRVIVDLALGGTEGDADGDVYSNIEVLEGSNFNDILTGTAGDDAISALLGNDRIDGGAGDDFLYGGAGADTFLGGAGADFMRGDSGFDSVDYRGATSRVAFNVDTGGTVGDAAGDTYITIERYYASNFSDTITGSDANEFFYGEGGNDTINAGGGIDRIYGGDGNDIQRGQDGNDLLYGSAGNDQMNGGTGFDIASYEFATSRVVLNLASGGTLGDAAGDTYFGIEVVRGSAFNDIIAGNNSANELRGLDGDDTLNGGGGNDRLIGGDGADALNGGTGADIAVYTDASAAVQLDLAGGGSSGEATGDSFSSVEWVWGSDFNDHITGDSANNRLEGRDGDDVLNGASGNDRLLGGDGNDTINGGDGVDTIFGQSGNDILSGGAGNDFFFGSAGGDSMDGGADFDTVSYLASSSGVIVNLQTGGTGGDAAGDSYVSIERVLGTGQDDSIRGSDGDNTLLGNGGNDYLEGGLGTDTLIGGAGTDSYGYNTTNSGSDFINGFSTAGEIIYILGGDAAFDTFAEVMAAGSDAGSNAVFDFGGGNTLTIVGQNLADLDAGDFDFGGTPPAQTLIDIDNFAQEPLSFDEIVELHGSHASQTVFDYNEIG